MSCRRPAAESRARPKSCACRFRGTEPALPLRDLQGLRCLGLMRVRRPGVDLQLRDLLAREPVPGEHPLDRLAQHFGRAPLQLRAQRAGAETAGIAGMAVVQLLVELLAGDVNL